MPKKLYVGAARAYKGTHRRHTVPSASVARLLSHRRRLLKKASRDEAKAATPATPATPAAIAASENALVRSEEKKAVYAALNDYVPKYNVVRRWLPDFVDPEGRVFYCGDRKRDQSAYEAMNIDADGSQTIVFVLLPIFETRASEHALDFPPASSQTITVYRPLWKTMQSDPEKWLHDITHRRVDVYNLPVVLPIEANDMAHPGRAVGILVVPMAALTKPLSLAVFPTPAAAETAKAKATTTTTAATATAAAPNTAMATS
jgi:hypothetical protein